MANIVNNYDIYKPNRQKSTSKQSKFFKYFQELLTGYSEIPNSILDNELRNRFYMRLKNDKTCHTFLSPSLMPAFRPLLFKSEGRKHLPQFSDSNV